MNLNLVLDLSYRLVAAKFGVGLNRDRLSMEVFRQIVIRFRRNCLNLVLDQVHHLEVEVSVLGLIRDLLVTEVFRPAGNQLNLVLDLNLVVAAIVEAVILDLVRFRCYQNCLTLVLGLIHRLVVVRLEKDLTIGRGNDLNPVVVKKAV